MSERFDQQDTLREIGASVGQREHWEVDNGLRDIDQPTEAPSWWQQHRALFPTCSCRESGDSEATP